MQGINDPYRSASRGRADGTTTCRSAFVRPRWGHYDAILVVEDDVAVLKVTRNRPVAFGYSVIEAKTVTDAIRLLEADGPVSLIFSDVRMPGNMSEYDLAVWIAKNRPEIQILLTSCYNE